MAFISADIRVFETADAITVKLYFPTDLPPFVGSRVRGVITLLHGMGNSCGEWMQFSAACRYAADNGFILIAPNAQNSFYHDMAAGAPWYTILTQLLPKQLHRIFKIPLEREKNYIAGLSMGGYGALRIGMSQPQQYAAIGSFSGATDLVGMAKECGDMPLVGPILQSAFGPKLDIPPQADLFVLAKELSHLPAEQQPRIYCSCGTSDTDHVNVYAQNQKFKAYAQSLPLSYHYEEWPGVHEWNFWDRSLAEFIGFIKQNDYGSKKCADWSSAKYQSTP